MKMRSQTLNIKKLNRRDLIALLESLEQENAQLQENITQLTQITTHPDLTQLPKGTNAEILSNLTKILQADKGGG